MESKQRKYSSDKKPRKLSYTLSPRGSLLYKNDELLITSDNNIIKILIIIFFILSVIFCYFIFINYREVFRLEKQIKIENNDIKIYEETRKNITKEIEFLEFKLKRKEQIVKKITGEKDKDIIKLNETIQKLDVINNTYSILNKMLEDIENKIKKKETH